MRQPAGVISVHGRDGWISMLCVTSSSSVQVYWLTGEVLPRLGQHATISSRPYSRAWALTSVMCRAAEIRPRRAVVEDRLEQARTRGKTRHLSFRLRSRLLVCGKASDVTSRWTFITNVSMQPQDSLGFFSDSTSARALERRVDAGSVTVESCVAACQAQGFFLAGV